MEVSLERTGGVVHFDHDRITPADIVATINRLGFQARLFPGSP